MSSPFKSKMEDSEKKTRSNIILALDLFHENRKILLENATHILEMMHRYICAVKINRQLVLPLGLWDGVKKILEQAQDLKLPIIMDCKINDVGHTNLAIAKQYFEAGFDAVTASPFVGWEDGLEPVFEIAGKMNRGVIILVYMSHKGAWEGYGQTVYDPARKEVRPQYAVFAEKALLWNADGAVVGATYPDKISEVHRILAETVPIYSPGVGAQGGDIEVALRSGAHYLIIGRSITYAPEPDKAAKDIRERSRRVLGV